MFSLACQYFFVGLKCSASPDMSFETRSLHEVRLCISEFLERVVLTLSIECG